MGKGVEEHTCKYRATAWGFPLTASPGAYLAALAKKPPEGGFRLAKRRGRTRGAQGLGSAFFAVPSAFSFLGSALATLVAGAAPPKLWPLTVRPSVDSLAAAFSLTPLTRL